MLALQCARARRACRTPHTGRGPLLLLLLPTHVPAGPHLPLMAPKHGVEITPQRPASSGLTGITKKTRNKPMSTARLGGPADRRPQAGQVLGGRRNTLAEQVLGGRRNTRARGSRGQTPTGVGATPSSPKVGGAQGWVPNRRLRPWEGSDHAAVQGGSTIPHKAPLLLLLPLLPLRLAPLPPPRLPPLLPLLQQLPQLLLPLPPLLLQPTQAPATLRQVWIP